MDIVVEEEEDKEDILVCPLLSLVEAKKIPLNLFLVAARTTKRIGDSCNSECVP